MIIIFSWFLIIPLKMYSLFSKNFEVNGFDFRMCNFARLFLRVLGP